MSEIPTTHIDVELGGRNGQRIALPSDSPSPETMAEAERLANTVTGITSYEYSELKAIFYNALQKARYEALESAEIKAWDILAETENKTVCPSKIIPTDAGAWRSAGYSIANAIRALKGKS